MSLLTYGHGKVFSSFLNQVSILKSYCKAEILGVVASGIAVAQVASAIVESIRKIYSLTSEIKDPPKKLSDLLVEIELLGEILVDYGDQSHTGITGQSSAFQKILKHFKTAMKDLDELLKVLENNLSKDGGKAKKQWRALKIVLKGKVLEELVERLERAKLLLTLA